MDSNLPRGLPVQLSRAASLCIFPRAASLCSLLIQLTFPCGFSVQFSRIIFIYLIFPLFEKFLKGGLGGDFSQKVTPHI